MMKYVSVIVAGGLMVGLWGCQEATSSPRTVQPVSAAAADNAYQRAMALLQLQFRDQDPIVRANVIEAVQGSADVRAQEIIETGLRDRQWLVRFAAAMAAGKRKAAAVLPVLEQLADEDASKNVRVGAIYALQRLGNSKRMTQLATYLNDPDQEVRANSALVLGLLGDPSAAPLLHARRGDVVARVKFELTAALARLGDEPACNAIRAMSLSRFTDEQFLAMQIASDINLTEAGNIMLAGLDHPMAEGQLLAVRGLGRLGSRQGEDFALKHAEDSNETIRVLAALALGDIPGPGKLERLTSMLSDRATRVQVAAASALLNRQNRKLD
jgi:HEAT repeat protein